MNFTFVYDNNSYQEKIKTGWGFSCLVQGIEKTILFDTGGEGPTLLRNMEKVAIDPKSIDTVVLSHIHGDHIGGLDNFLEVHPNVTVFMPKSFPRQFVEKVEKYGAQVVIVKKSLEIYKDVYLTGELGDWIKEQSLILKTDRGFVLLTGCAHPGIVDIVKESKNLTNDRALFIMGGFHLRDHGQEEIRNLIDGIRDLGVEYVGPCHCTGDFARSETKKEYGEYYREVGVGKRIFLKDLKNNGLDGY